MTGAEAGTTPYDAGVLLLASRSPRRAALLQAAGIAYELGPIPDVDETPPVGAGGARLEGATVVRALALRKAEAAHVLAPRRRLLAADTLVFLDGHPVGKPVDGADARRILRSLSGRAHDVCTGLALLGPDARGEIRRLQEVACSRVHFRELTDAEIETYVAGGEPLDKAGAYGIQGGAAGFVSALDGELDTVIGLPVATLRELLRAFDAPEAG